VSTGDETDVVRLVDGSVAVRRWAPEDAESLSALANDRRVWLALRDRFPHPYAIEDARRFLLANVETNPPRNFAIEVDGETAGGIGFVQNTDVERVGAEVGYWLGRRFWGRGVATVAVRLLSRHLFATNDELRRLYALPFATNLASARVLEKAGYTLEGTLRQSAIKEGAVLDQRMYSILRHEVER
jgi:RimJ/RimL family protein N-acetyltransferase